MDRQAIQHVLDRYHAVLNSHDRDGIADEFRGAFEGIWYAFPDRAIPGQRAHAAGAHRQPANRRDPAAPL
jgi:hypothetical protein